MSISSHILKLNDIITNICNYDTINKLSQKKLRNIPNGISLNDALMYKFMYAQINTTKESICAYINNYNKTNNINNNTFDRKSYESKEKNIPIEFYSLMANKVIELYNNVKNAYDNDINNLIYVAVDGSNTNDLKQNVMLNMCNYDIINRVPLNLVCNGKENRNKEVQMLLNDVMRTPEKYKNVVLIGDRLYFTYKLMHFLHENSIKFIIRAKGNADNLEKDSILNKNMKSYKKICELKNVIRIVRCKNKYKKTVFSGHKKKSEKKTYSISVANDCVLITNLLDAQTYADNDILNLYRLRWEIEIYFKLLKANMKFQFMKESSTEQYNRLYICEVIVTYILRLIEFLYMKNNNIETSKKKKVDRKIISYTVKVNDSLLVSGIFNTLLNDFLYAQLTEKKITDFCSSYIQLVANTKDRRYPRTSKKPFSKWYLKGYSAQTRLIKILQAIEDGKIKDLNKNLKLIAKKIKITGIVT